MAQTFQTPTAQQNGDKGSIAQRAKSFVTSEARHLAEERGVNEKVAARLEQYQQALGSVRQNLGAADGSRTVAYLEDLAARVEEFGDCVREGDYRGAGRCVRSFADEHPEVFLGLTFATGAFVGRILREAVARESKNSDVATVDSAPADRTTSGTGGGGGRAADGVTIGTGSAGPTGSQQGQAKATGSTYLGANRGV